MLIYFLTFILTISVVRSDPFSPSFSENIYTLEVLEDKSVISQLLVIIATDIDTPLVFEQTSNFPEFEVTSGGILNLIQPLDREKISSFNLKVKVHSIVHHLLLCSQWQGRKSMLQSGGDVFTVGERNLTYQIY